MVLILRAAAESAVAFTRRALAWFKRFGVSVERIMTDNGSACKSFAFRGLLAEQAIRHKRTRPYTPRTNGKAERFIQTSLREVRGLFAPSLLLPAGPAPAQAGTRTGMTRPSGMTRP
jgi:transposase InsO family protein